MRSEHHRIVRDDGPELAARVDLPDDAAASWALFAHCFTCTKDLKSIHWLSEALTDRGIGVLRFDFAGLGESGGDFAETDFSSNIADLLAATVWMRGRGHAPALLIGHSLGGAAVLAAAKEIEESRAVVTLGAPSTTGHLSRTLLDLAPELAHAERAEVTIAGRRIEIGAALIRDLQSHSLEHSVRSLGRALLVLHSPVDEIVPLEHAARIYGWARHPKSFIALDGADHLLLRREDARYAANLVATWVTRYAGAADEV